MREGHPASGNFQPAERMMDGQPHAAGMGGQIPVIVAVAEDDVDRWIADEFLEDRRRSHVSEVHDRVHLEITERRHGPPARGDAAVRIREHAEALDRWRRGGIAHADFFFSSRLEKIGTPSDCSRECWTM